ncbi:MAG: hypothetical protein D6731_18430 [Planctomycetota bacterium]|nr:MAG: hypothetical protein D6731_18430 [Planctomycetota bacterium]
MSRAPRPTDDERARPGRSARTKDPRRGSFVRRGALLRASAAGAFAVGVLASTWIALVAPTGGGAGTSRGTAARGTPAGPAARGTNSTAGQGAEFGANDAPLAPDGAVRAGASAGAVVLSGRLRWRGWRGLRWRLRVRPLAPRGEPFRVDLDAVGRFDTALPEGTREVALELLPGGEEPLAWEDVSATVGGTPRVLRGGRLSLAPGRNALDLSVARRAVAGRVFDEEGVPVRGARVALAGEGRSTTTDSEGRFLLWSLGAPIELTAEAPGYALARRTLAEGALVEPTRLVLEKGVDLEVLAVGPSGRPLQGARVRAWLSSPGGSVDAFPPRVAGSDGRARVRGLPRDWRRSVIAAGCRLHVAASCEGFVDAEVVVLEGVPEPVSVVLAPEAVFSGRVVTSNGRPLAGARVGRLAEGDDAEEVLALGLETVWVESDDEGRFVLHGLKSGRQRFFVRAAGLPPKVFWETLPAEGVEVVLRSGRVLGGTVLDGSGAPLPGVVVLLRRPGAEGSSAADGRKAPELSRPALGIDANSVFSFASGRFARTDAEGRFRLEGLEEECYDVQLLQGDRAQLVRGVTAQEGMVLRFAAPSPARLVFVLCDAAGEDLLPDEVEGFELALRDQAGRLLANEIDLDVESSGRASLPLPADRLEGVVRLSLELASAASPPQRLELPVPAPGARHDVGRIALASGGVPVRCRWTLAEPVERAQLRWVDPATGLRRKRELGPLEAGDHELLVVVGPGPGPARFELNLWPFDAEEPRSLVWAGVVGAGGADADFAEVPPR